MVAANAKRAGKLNNPHYDKLPPLGSFPRSKQGMRLEDWCRNGHRYVVNGNAIVDTRQGHTSRAIANCIDKATAILIGGLLNIDDIAGERYRLEQLRTNELAQRDQTKHTK